MQFPLNLKKTLPSVDIIGDFLCLWADDLQKWVNTLRCELFLLHPNPDSLPANFILPFQKSMIFFLVGDIGLYFCLFWAMLWDLKILEFLFASFQMYTSGTRCSSEYSTYYLFLIDGECFQVYNKVQSQELAAGRVYHVSLALGSFCLCRGNAGAQYGAGLLGGIQGSNSGNVNI